MSIASEITRINTNIANSYTAVDNKNGTLPQVQNSANLASAINSIEVIEQATAEGESLNLVNTKAMPYSDYVVEGKSEQEGTPSPSNPSEIHSVADDDINLLNINDFPISSNVSKEIKNNHLILTATGTSGAQVVATYVKNVDSSKNYTLSFKAKKIVKGTDGGPYIRVALYGSNVDSSYSLFKYIDNTNPTQGQEYSFTASFTGYKYYMLYFYNNTSTPVTIGEKTDYWDIKFQEGTVATPYSPYNQGTVTIKQRGKNKNDGINYGFYIGAEATTYRISGADNGICIPTKNQVYTISSKEIQNRYRIACSNSLPSDTSQNCFNGVVKDGTNDNVTIDTSGYKYLLINCTNINDIQIEQGSTATPYEPYQANDYTIQTEPLRSLPNGVKDTIEEDGIHRKMFMVDMGDLEWILRSR